jgi:hypothetical protein
MDFSKLWLVIGFAVDAKTRESGAGGPVVPRAMLKTNAASPPD